MKSATPSYSLRRPNRPRRRTEAWNPQIVTLSGLALIADLVTKGVAFAAAPQLLTASTVSGAVGPRVDLHLVAFQAEFNAGANLGLAVGSYAWLLGVTGLIAAFLLLAVAIRHGPHWRPLSLACLVFLIAGTLGNSLDRVVYGGVRDFIVLLPNAQLPLGLQWPSGETALLPLCFNLADCWLLLGLCLLAQRLWQTKVPA